MSELSWDDLSKQFKQIKQTGEQLWAHWESYEGSENYGIWLLIPDGPDTDEARAVFSLNAARAIAKLKLAPIPAPEPWQHCENWAEHSAAEEARGHQAGKEIDLSDAVPYGLGDTDRDAIDPCTRTWLELLRRESTAFETGQTTETLGGRTYQGLIGTIPDVCGASAVFCLRQAREEIRESLAVRANVRGDRERLVVYEQLADEQTAPSTAASIQPSGVAVNDSTPDGAPLATGENESRPERERSKRRDLLERLSPSDPNYEIAKNFYLEAWADSHGLVADAYAGRGSLSDFVDGCARTFEQGAQLQVSLEDTTPIPTRCSELDRMARKFIRKFRDSVLPEGTRLGKAKATAAVKELSRRVNEITARSKQQICEGELAMSALVPKGTPAMPAAKESPASIRHRRKQAADLNAMYERRLGRIGLEVERQEALLIDARKWAEAELSEVGSDVKNVQELRKRVVKRTWDKFVPGHPYHASFQLGYVQFESALWEEGSPSLEDVAKISVRKRGALKPQGAGGEIISELQLADPPDDPKRVYESSRCWFRGGHVDPVASMDLDFLAACTAAARTMTGNPGATADDFLEILRVRCVSQDRWRLRVESAHGAAAFYFEDLMRFPDRYPELQNAAAAGLTGEELVTYWSVALEPVHARFVELLRRDKAAKMEEVHRQNVAFATGQPTEKGKYPFSVEFPDVVPILRKQMLEASKKLVEQLEPEHAAGDIRLLSEPDSSLKSTVTFERAKQYLGLTMRQVQRLVKATKLQSVGGGQSKQITVASLLEYCPARKSDQVRQKTT